MRRVLVALAASVLLASPAVAKEKKQPKQVRELLAMSPEQHAERVATKDDRLEAVATLDTSQSFQYKYGLLRIVWDDIFLRAFVDKASLTTTYQVYFRLHRPVNTWPRLETVNFETTNGLRTEKLRSIGSDVDCSTERLTGSCTFTEVVVFEVEEALLREIAARYVPDTDNAWQMRFKGQSGLDVDISMMPAEVGGLLLAVDNYKGENTSPLEDQEEPAIEVGTNSKTANSNE